MAHLEQQEFCLSIREKYKDKFIRPRVLDIGSLDINGNNRYLFYEPKYIGIDIGYGANVDVVCRGHEFIDYAGFDIVITTECLEHDEYWSHTLSNAISLVKEEGLLIMTCATTGRPEHGTIEHNPESSPFTASNNNYYMNLTEQDIRNHIDLDTIFLEYAFSTNELSCDLYLYGVKAK